MDEKSITRAGERIHLSQSAMSGALARLRDFFHDELLVQVGHKMVLTPLAEELIEPVREALLRIEALVNKDSSFDPQTSTRKFRVMMSEYVAMVSMTEILPGLQQIAPGITFDLLSNAEGGPAALDRGEIDLLIMPKQLISTTHPSQDLFSDRFTCVVWSGNREVGDSLSMQQYLEAGHVIARFGTHQIHTLDEDFFDQLGLRRRIEIVAMSFTILPQLIIGTPRVATVHRRLAEQYVRLLPLRIVEPPIQIPPLTECVQWHKIRNSDRGVQWLRKVLMDTVNRNEMRAEARETASV